MTLPLCAAVAFAEKGRLRCLSIISGSAQLMALALTYSRGSWLGFLISIICFGGALNRKGAGIFLVMLALAVSLATPLRDRVMSLLQPRTDVAISERLDSIEAGIQVGLAHPILGVGYGRGRLREGLRELYGDAPGGIHRIAHTHNLYIELFAGIGVLGLASFLWLLGQALFRTVAAARGLEGANRTFQFGIAASLVAFAATALGDVPFYHHSVRILFFTLLALAHLGCRNIDSSRNHV
jgi:putative inorganic carbon (HCO3(-)) transporter